MDRAAISVAVVAVVVVTVTKNLKTSRAASAKGVARVSCPPDLFGFRMEEHIEVEGKILTVLAGTMFRVELDNRHQVLATISGKMRKRFVRLTVGDRVKMEMSPYDLNKARIVWRLG